MVTICNRGFAMMDFNTYQEATRRNIPIIPNYDIVYSVLGLVGETGEIAEKFKKLFRDHNGVITSEFINSIKLELGDVLWYIADCARVLGLSLDDVANTNIEKNNRRQRDGTIKGSGDYR